MSTRNKRGQRGLSLIEALVALAIMGIGMLGLVGVQGTLRGNSDLSKQRSEAVRIAQEDIERWRAFATLGAVGGNGYGDLAVGTVIDPAIVGTNASYVRERRVDELGDPREAKSLRITVSWTDRSGNPQSVQLATVIAGIAPELALTMAVPGTADMLTQPLGRNRSIPVQARDFGGLGSSDYVPPGSAPGVAWRFDNVTGLITLCTVDVAVTTTAALTSHDDLTCGADKAQLLSGFLRYALTPAQPTADDVANPAGPAPVIPPLVFVDYNNDNNPAPANPPIRRPCYRENDANGVFTAYRCAVPVIVLLPGVAPTWSGTVVFQSVPGATIAANVNVKNSTQLKSCRYAQTPARYDMVDVPKTNQNFVFIRAGDEPPGATAFTCPAPTVAHQPS